MLLHHHVKKKKKNAEIRVAFGEESSAGQTCLQAQKTPPPQKNIALGLQLSPSARTQREDLKTKTKNWRTRRLS